MPKWDIDLSDGRTVTVESDLEPSEDEVLSAVGSQAQPQSPDIGSQFLFAPDPFALPTERERLASQAAEIRNAPPVTAATGFAEELVDRFGDFIGGAAQFVPSTLKAIGAGMSRPEALAENVPMIEPPPPGPPEEHPIYQAGTRAQQFVDESFPQPEEFSFPRAVVRGAGQMVPMLAGGAAARVLGAGPAAAAGVGAGIGTAMEFDDAFERSRRRGDNPDEAFAKSLGYATISGLIENRLGAGRILRQMFPNPVQAAQKLTAMGVSKKILGNFVAGGAEEGSQQFAQNWIVEGEPSMEGVAESAAVGSVVEGTAGLPSAAVTPQVERPPNAVPPESAPPVPNVQQPEVAQASAEQVPVAQEVQGASEPRISRDEAEAQGPEAITAIMNKYGVSRDEAVSLQSEARNRLGISRELPGTVANLDDALRARGYGDLHIQKMSESEKQSEAAKPIPTPEEDAIRFWETEDAIKEEKDINKRAALLQSVFMERELIKNRNPKLKGAVPDRPAATEPIGMGGELATAQPSGTGLKNEVGEQERIGFGLPAAYPTISRKMLPVWNASAEILRKDPQAGEKLAAELKINPERGMTDEDSALLLRHKVALENAKNQAAEDSITAATPEAKQEALDRFDDLSNQLLDLLDAAKFRGSQWGREGRWRQALAFEDYSLETMRRQKRLKADRDLTPEEEAETKREHDEITAKRKAAEEAQSRDEKKSREADAKDSVSEAVKTAKDRQSKQKGAGVVRDLDSEQNEIIAFLKDSFIENGDLADTRSSIRKLMELLVEREGITERIPLEDRVHEILSGVDPTLTREGTLDLMSGYGKSTLPSQEPAKKIVRDIAQQIISVRKLLDYFKGKRPSLTGILRDAPSDIQRGWLKMVNEAKKVFKLEVSEDNAKAIKSATDAINTRLKNRIRDLKQEIVTRQKIIRERSPSPYNAETLRLRQELESLQAQHAEIFGSGLTPAEQLARLEKSAERQIEELERQIKSGEIFPRSQQAIGLTSDKLDAAKARIEELKLQRQFARESLQPKMEPHERFLLNYLLRIRQREAAYKEKLAKGEFEKVPKPKRELSQDVLKALADVEKAKGDFQRGLHKYELSRRSRIQKIWDAIKDTRNAFVNIISSYDFSAPRQAFSAVLSNVSRLVTNPIGGAKLLSVPFQKMFSAWSGEKRSQAIDQWIKNRPNALSGADKTAGIQYTDLHSETFSKREENARSVLDDWAALPLRTGNAVKTAVTAVPKLGARGVRMSNRAFITYLNTTRALLFDELLRANFQDRAPTEAQLKVLGNLVNIMTGRGAISPKAASVASEVLWAPSLLTSRVQLLTGQPFWGKAGREGGGKARLIVAKEYARIITSGAVLFAISQMFDDDDEGEEPTSSDFGKVVRGKTRIDPWAGYQQVAVLMARLKRGETTSISGDTRDISKIGQGEVIWNFFKNKARPDIVAAVKATVALLDLGKATEDVRVTPAEAAKGAVPVPLAIREVIEVMRDRGMTEGAIIEALALFGAGVSVYEEREAQK